MSRLYFEEDHCLSTVDQFVDTEEVLLEAGLEYLTEFSPEISEFE